MTAPHASEVTSAAYSPDGARVVTASLDRTARIWDARTGAPVAILSGHSDHVNSAMYSPDGLRIVTASNDTTAGIWDARIPASLAAQILWDASAQTDPLPAVGRTKLGLPPDVRARSWPASGSACDRSAAAVYDPDRLTPGSSLENVTVDIAGPACAAEISKPDHAARFDYEMGRTLIAKGDANGARRQFEATLARGYRAARIDLADLSIDASKGMPDPGRAVSLYQQAWADGVPVAAFMLGHLYEHGLPPAAASRGAAFAADASKAWLWYRQGADAGEPMALGRLAEREERTALAATNPSTSNAQLLQAFRLYAAAAERARAEGWPDDAWKHWRYRRASLARLLAQQGMMQQVADAYRATRLTAVAGANRLTQ
jgi:TPR repeat protein